MKITKALAVSYIALLMFTSCKDDEPEGPDSSCPPDNVQKIDQLVNGTGNLPDAIGASPPTLVGSKEVTVSENGTDYECVEHVYNFANNMSDLVAMNPNAGTLYPGSLVQGNAVRSGILNSIGNFERAPLQITMNNYGINTTVPEPSNATIDQAIAKMIESNPNTIAKVSSKIVEIHSYDQAMLELGIDVSWGAVALQGSMSTKSETERHSVLLSFIQEYYTVSAEQPSTPSKLFAPCAQVDDLSKKIYTNNPLCYVSSVTYGRMLFARISSTKSVSEMKAKIAASYKIVNGSLEYQQTNAFDSYEVEVRVMGGNAQDAVIAAQGKMEGIISYLNNGANYSPSSRGVPISYVVRHASDNSVVHLGKALNYSQYTCSDKKTIYFTPLRFEIIADCDDSPLPGNDPGDFVYKIVLSDASPDATKTIDSLEENTAKQLNNGDNLQIQSGARTLQITNKQGHKLQILVDLRDEDGFLSGGDEILSETIDFPFPFENISAVEDQKEILLEKNDKCKAKFYYIIRRK